MPPGEPKSMVVRRVIKNEAQGRHMMSVAKGDARGVAGLESFAGNPAKGIQAQESCRWGSVPKGSFCSS
jgi:hypothetical protein